MVEIAPPLGPRAKKLALFLSGANLLIVQFLMIRNFSSILFGSEMIILLATLSYFGGYSLGYFFSDRVGARVLDLFSAGTLALHFTLPFSLRYLFGALLEREHDFLTLALSLFIMTFLLSSFYSLLLPRFVSEEGAENLAPLYGAELAGAVLGIGVIFSGCLLDGGDVLVMAFYLGSLAVILGLLWRSRLLAASVLASLVFYVKAYPALERESVTFFYGAAKSMPDPRMVFSANTPYQRIEVVRDRFGQGHLYLDGVRHFGGDSLDAFNDYIAGIPASLLERPRVLIVGSGSLGSLARVLPRAARVDTVEIDRRVIEAGMRFFEGDAGGELLDLRREKWTLHIDDAKHFIKNAPEKYDLVVMDIAGPFQMQVALLYTEEFYRLAAEKLAPGGVIAVSLNGQLARESANAGRITRTLAGVFPDLFVVAPWDDSNFALAGNGLRFSKSDLEKQIKLRRFARTRVYGRDEVLEMLSDGAYEKISLKNMDIVLKRGWNHLLADYLEFD
ncbi:MAG: hypothetical protein A2636_03430 [Elusimicrobia bacterium RIFCSPHIGHO2_01_FULL_64_10]|nr:MAG: hypothetical protein A2636_03430 [Elusimicrobia bacterium RIFCSPHIGHO2_01_FULL_64_10]